MAAGSKKNTGEAHGEYRLRQEVTGEARGEYTLRRKEVRSAQDRYVASTGGGRK